jgi:hypothetical protein
VNQRGHEVHIRSRIPDESVAFGETDSNPKRHILEYDGVAPAVCTAHQRGKHDNL